MKLVFQTPGVWTARASGPRPVWTRRSKCGSTVSVCNPWLAFLKRHGGRFPTQKPEPRILVRVPPIGQLESVRTDDVDEILAKALELARADAGNATQVAHAGRGIAREFGERRVVEDH